MTDFSKKYAAYLEFFERALKHYCTEMKYFPPVLADSLRYSLLSGGKRVRPVLFFAALELFGLPFDGETNFAIALECIHTYSLIHDDLPAMDDDDYRRGNPSNHKVFGEANAILAGDALLSEGCSLAVKEAKRGERAQRAAEILMDAAGPSGMVAGQSADLLFTGENASDEDLDFIYVHKTGKLLAAPLQMAAALAGIETDWAERFGIELGRLFQLTDDLLDVKGDSARMGKTLGKDAKEDKATCVKLFGLERSEALADQSASNCLAHLRKVRGDTSFLEGIVRLVRERDI